MFLKCSNLSVVACLRHAYRELLPYPTLIRCSLLSVVIPKSVGLLRCRVFDTDVFLNVIL